MGKNKVGRPSKINKEAMQVTDASIAAIIVILLVLLSFAVVMFTNPGMVEHIKASIGNLFK